MKIIDSWIPLPGLVALLAIPTVAVAQQPCEEVEGFHQMDFWVGEWEVRVDDRQVGTNRITKILDGCAVQEDWKGVAGGEGRSLFYYLPSSDEWKQVWVTTNATRLGGVKEKTLVATLADGSLQFQGRIPDSEGTLWYDRTTLTPLEGGRVRQHIQISQGGKVWETTFDAVYVPAG